MFDQVKNTGNKFLTHLNKRTEIFGAQMVTFGIFGLVNYPLFYILWPHLAPHDYTNFYIRMLATLLCIPLIFKKYWPKILLPYQTIYWYLTLLYCLPFFVTFMVLKNFTSSSWQTNVMIAMFILILLVDWLSALVLLTLGFFAGWGFYHISTNAHYYPLTDYVGPFTNYIFAIIIGIIFSRNKEKLHREKLQGMSAVGGRVAHELRTPLLAIKARASGGRRYLPRLIEAYNQAQQAGLNVPEIRRDRFQALDGLMGEIADEVSYANTVIDMMLVNVQGRPQNIAMPLDHYSIVECVNEAIRRYPFNTRDERENVHFHSENDFNFYGSKILTVHILFNLLKNALYFMTKNAKGNIEISIESTKRYNTLRFKDTAQGIPPEHLSHLFNLFYSTTTNGTGIGLSFCKTAMESFGGNIQCYSVYGEYTEFFLNFPKMQNLSKDVI